MSSPWTAGHTPPAPTHQRIPTQRDSCDDTKQLATRKAAVLSRLRIEQPDLCDLALAAVADPPHIADTDPVLGWLSGMESEGVMVLEQRASVAGVIDYLALAASGIFVVTARSGQQRRVEIQRSGGFLVPKQERLLIGSEDRTFLVADLWPRIEAVYDAIEDNVAEDTQLAAAAFVRPVLALTEVSLPVFSVLEVGGVPIVGSRRLAQMLRRPGPLDLDQRARLLRVLAARLRPAQLGALFSETA